MVKRRKTRKRIRPRRAEKVCSFCQLGKKPEWQDYVKLRQLLSPRARILSREFTGLCRKHQRQAAKAIKQARFLGLLPFVAKVER